MTDIARSATEKWLLGIACLCMVAGLLFVGLWPFNFFLKNEVNWVPGKDGLVFGDNGVILSHEMFDAKDSGAVATGTIELRLTPVTDNDVNTIFAFSTPENHTSLSVAQFVSDMVVRRYFPVHRGRVRMVHVDIGHAFQKGKRALYTLTFGLQGTTVYVDGVLDARFPDFFFAPKDFSGQIVFGTDPVYFSTWGGLLQGLAIYTQELSAEQVLQNYGTWNDPQYFDQLPNQHVDALEREGALALYTFRERAGNVVHNRLGPELDLYIPPHFRIPRKAFLQSPLLEFRLDRPYVKDVTINVLGFIPFGFLVCAYLSMRRPPLPSLSRSESQPETLSHTVSDPMSRARSHAISHPRKRDLLLTIVLGTLVSLTIEMLQAYLPTRYSDMTDVITNTSGAALGAVLYAWAAVQSLPTKSGTR